MLSKLYLCRYFDESHPSRNMALLTDQLHSCWKILVDWKYVQSAMKLHFHPSLFTRFSKDEVQNVLRQCIEISITSANITRTSFLIDSSKMLLTADYSSHITLDEGCGGHSYTVNALLVSNGRLYSGSDDNTINHNECSHRHVERAL